MRIVIASLLLLLCSAAGAQTRLDYFMMEAMKCRMQNNLSASMEMYRHCLEIEPNSAEALFQVGMVHLFLNEDSVGMDCLERAVALDTNNAYYTEVLASMYIRKAAIDEAVPLLEKLSKLQSKRSDVLYQLAKIYAQNEEYERSIQVYDKVELLEGKLPSISRDKFALYMQMGDSVKAFSELQSLCDEYPADMGYRIGMAYAHQNMGNYDEALKIYNQVRRVDPDNMSLSLAMMDYYMMRGEDSLYIATRDSILYDRNIAASDKLGILQQMSVGTDKDSVRRKEMLQVYDKVLQLDTTSTDLLTMYAMYLEATKSSNVDIHNILIRLMDVAPDNEMAIQWLMRYYGDQADYDALEKVCRKGANYYPQNLSYHYFLGVALLLQGHGNDALDALGHGLRVKTSDANPKMVASMFSSRGDILHDLGKDKEAYAEYDSALVYNPDDAMCLNNYAYFLSLDKAQLDKAEEMSYRAVKMEPGNSTYIDTYAWIMFMQGKYEDAAKYMDEIVPREELDSFLQTDTVTSAVLLEHAGDIAWMTGDKHRAVLLWQAAHKRTEKGVSPMLEKKARKKKYYKKK